MLVSPDSLDAINKNLSDKALSNLKDAIDSGSYTGPELMAMKVFEELKLIGDLDLASILLKGQRLREIRELNLASYLPGKYGSAEEAIQVEARISRTQQSIITNLFEHVFPYVVEELGMTVQEFWNDVSISNAGEIVPHLRMIITDEPSKSEGVRTKVAELLREKGHEVIDETGEPDNKEVKKRAVQELISLSTGTNDDVRKALRPDGTPPISLAVIRTNGTRFILAEITEDQLAMLNRAFGRHLDIFYHDEELDTLPIFKRLGATNEL